MRNEILKNKLFLMLFIFSSARCYGQVYSFRQAPNNILIYGDKIGEFFNPQTNTRYYAKSYFNNCGIDIQQLKDSLSTIDTLLLIETSKAKLAKVSLACSYKKYDCFLKDSIVIYQYKIMVKSSTQNSGTISSFVESFSKLKDFKEKLSNSGIVLLRDGSGIKYIYIHYIENINSQFDEDISYSFVCFFLNKI